MASKPSGMAPALGITRSLQQWLTSSIITVLCLGGACTRQDSSIVAERMDPAELKTLVIVVPSVFSGDSDWANVEGMGPDGTSPTFASELLAAAPPRTDVKSIRWNRGAWAGELSLAAERIVRMIDEEAGEYDRIVLVGHSHGGNLALLAAGRCKRPVDELICLATPFIYLRVNDPSDDQTLSVPVFCTKRTRENTRSIVAVVATGDEVGNTWLNFLTAGASHDEAVELTRGWIDELGLDVPQQKQLWQRLFQGDHLFASDQLSLSDHHVELDLDVADAFGISPHTRIHDATVGREIGFLLSGVENRLTAGAVLPSGQVK